MRARRGRLTVVGLGIKGVSQLTPEAYLAITGAEHVLHAAADAGTAHWIARQVAVAEDLTRFFRRRTFGEAHDAMVEAILTPVRAGKRVCAAFYGSAAVGVEPAHRALAVARQEGYRAVMLPGVAADACLFADVACDPLASGYQAFDASDFVVSRRCFDPASALALWQVGMMGRTQQRHAGTAAGLMLLRRRLVPVYGAHHRVMFYRAGTRFGASSRVRRFRLEHLDSHRAGPQDILFVPPLPPPRRPSVRLLPTDCFSPAGPLR